MTFFIKYFNVVPSHLRSSATETADPSLSLPSSHDKRSSFVVFETGKQGKHYQWHCGWALQHKQKSWCVMAIHQNRNFLNLGKKLPGSWESWIVKPRKHLMLLGDLNKEKATIIYAGYCLSLVMAIYHIYSLMLSPGHITLTLLKLVGAVFLVVQAGALMYTFTHRLSYPPYLCMQWPKSFFSFSWAQISDKTWTIICHVYPYVPPI